jgi:murein DD-endopeptidase MepM/ murein hydrolase activator NlpD
MGVVVFKQSLRRFAELYGLSILRLAVILCLFHLCLARFFPPGAFPNKPKSPENGIGGGSVVSEIDSAGETEIESGIFELEYLSKPQTLLYDAYAIQKDDMIGNLADSFGLNQDSLISVNNIRNTRLLQIGHVLRIPNQDGILYTVRAGDTLEAIAERNKAEVRAIQTANELFSDNVHSGTVLFIPGARLDWANLQEINGDLFIWPVPGRVTSPYGYRDSPFTGDRQFHFGLDIGSPAGTPVRAAMPGRVSAAGWDNNYGNYVIINHPSGYRTLYGHLSVIRVKTGAYVGTGERIGDVGSTGLSTAPHLHFTVYKNGVTVNPRALIK